MNFSNNKLDKKADWMGTADEPLVGFSWESDPHEHSSGIIFWSDVFLSEQKGNDGKNEQVAIVLVDTQGLFNAITSFEDNVRIFALGALLSSVQVFNLNDVILENQLDFLHVASEYALLAKNNSISRRVKPFQNLMILVRDWAHKGNFKYGQNGGNMYQKSILQPKPGRNIELRSVRRFIPTSFDSVSCFLMPHPGLSATTDKFFDGRHSKLDNEFKRHLKNSIQVLLSPENLVKKKISDKEITAKEFRAYAKTYFETFQSPDTPQIHSLYSTTKKEKLSSLEKKTLKTYELKIRNINFNFQSNFSEIANAQHTEAKRTSLDWYQKQNKMGSTELMEEFRDSLENEMNAFFEQWLDGKLKAIEELKNLEQKHEQRFFNMKKGFTEKFQTQRQKHEIGNLKIVENLAKFLKKNNQIALDKQEEWSGQMDEILADKDRLKLEFDNFRLRIDKNLDKLLSGLGQEMIMTNDEELKMLISTQEQNAQQRRDRASANHKMFMELIQTDLTAK